MVESKIDSGHIVGKATLLVTFDGKLDGEAVMAALVGVGYPAADVRVYYRVEGTDQVIDAITGEVPAGVALARDVKASKEGLKFDTLVLLHPDAAQFVAVKGALEQFGAGDYKYAEGTVYEGKV